MAYIYNNQNEINHIIIDYEMNDMNGEEFALKLREIGVGNHIIFYSSHTDKYDFDKLCDEIKASWASKGHNFENVKFIIAKNCNKPCNIKSCKDCWKELDK